MAKLGKEANKLLAERVMGRSMNSFGESAGIGSGPPAADSGAAENNEQLKMVLSPALDGGLRLIPIDSYSMLEIQPVWLVMRHGALMELNDYNGIFLNRDEADRHIQRLRDEADVYDAAVVPMTLRAGYIFESSIEGMLNAENLKKGGSC